jgi:hypothetical protein
MRQFTALLTMEQHLQQQQQQQARSAAVASGAFSHTCMCTEALLEACCDIAELFSNKAVSSTMGEKLQSWHKLLLPNIEATSALALAALRTPPPPPAAAAGPVSSSSSVATSNGISSNMEGSPASTSRSSTSSGAERSPAAHHSALVAAAVRTLTVLARLTVTWASLLNLSPRGIMENHKNASFRTNSPYMPTHKALAVFASAELRLACLASPALHCEAVHVQQQGRSGSLRAVEVAAPLSRDARRNPKKKPQQQQQQQQQGEELMPSTLAIEPHHQRLLAALGIPFGLNAHWAAEPSSSSSSNSSASGGFVTALQPDLLLVTTALQQQFEIKMNLRLSRRIYTVTQDILMPTTEVHISTHMYLAAVQVLLQALLLQPDIKLVHEALEVANAVLLTSKTALAARGQLAASLPELLQYLAPTVQHILRQLQRQEAVQRCAGSTAELDRYRKLA